MSSNQTNQWNSSFWDCCSPFETCLCAWCCPCFLFGKTQARLANPNLTDFNYCNSNCVGWGALALCGFGWVLQTIRRGEMRNQLGINGSSFGDCCGAWCCPCCGLMQEEKEMVYRGEISQQAAEPYQPTKNMAYPPQP